MTHDTDTRLIEELRGELPSYKETMANCIKAASRIESLRAEVARLREALSDPQLPFTVALAVLNSHYRATGIPERTELEAFSEQYVKDARVSIATIRTALGDHQ